MNDEDLRNLERVAKAVMLIGSIGLFCFVGLSFVVIMLREAINEVWSRKKR